VKTWAGAGLCWLALSGAALAQAPAPAGAPPAAADLLFEGPQLANVAPGTVLTYRYRRQGGPAEQILGPPVDDRIRLTIGAGAKPDERTAIVEMFTGERHRAAGPFENTTANPVLILFLEHELGNVARVLGANPRYLKNAIRAALRDRAVVAPTTVEVAGKPALGWTVEVQPFLDDPKKERMRGLHTLRLRVQTADAVPGQILSVTAEAEAPGGKLVDESLTYESLR
jgi:hypothetical protein